MSTTSISERYADSPPVDSQRNGPMSNAERQRRYRDRQRGGPALGRWHGHKLAAAFANEQHISRTALFMAGWLLRHAPEAIADLDAGRLKITPTYLRIRHEHELAFIRALIAEKKAGDNGGGPTG